MIDSSDNDRIELAREELMKMLMEEEMRNVAVLVIANKQDMGVMTVPQITEKLGLNTLRS